MKEFIAEYLSPDDLIPYEMNAKLHPPEQVEHIANSIKAFGWTQPIVVDENNVVVIGHGRLMAAKQLNLDKVPVVRRDDLTEEQINACRLADNKTNESPWDFRRLEQELAELSIAGFDMESFGFVDEEEEKKKEGKTKPEVEFSEMIGEENNYLVLQFKNDIDWLYACTVFDIGTVKSYSTRKDGKVTEKMQRMGTARVLDGAKAISKILGEK